MRTISLYVHVPFCKRRCSYCTFYHVPYCFENESGFVDALVREFGYVVEEMDGPFQISTVFLGGGTPSVLSPDSLDRVFDAISPFLTSHSTEITVETNPEDVSDELLAALSARGANRLSLGIQTMSARGLKLLKRCTRDTNNTAIEIVARHFENFSLDLLLGVPGGTREELVDTLECVSRHEPKHLSVYCLESGGVMESDVRDFFERVDSEQSAEEYLDVCEHLRDRGYRHYEVSNFAVPGFESEHNLVYWRGRDYVGLGPGAHSFVDGRRFNNEPSIERYAANAEGRADRTRRQEPRDDAQRRLEALMLALRTADGLPLDMLGCRDTVVDNIVDGDLATVSDGRLVLTDRGFLVLNEIVLRLSEGSA